MEVGLPVEIYFIAVSTFDLVPSQFEAVRLAISLLNPSIDRCR